MGLRDLFRDKLAATAQPSRQDADAALAVATDLQAVAAEQARLRRDGVQATATIARIEEDVEQRAGMSWHELVLDVDHPERGSYRATRRVAVELSTVPGLAAGATVVVHVDRADPQVLVVDLP